ncbi:MAG: hypothetical protein IKV55_01670, partial [Oscillospiraceae bacterium]|nr:hypothetical protein [Oscillospiraceae bacterium]
MNITFKNPGCMYSAQSISLFLAEDVAPFWLNPILHFYPQLEKSALLKSSPTDRQQYLTAALSDVYENAKAEIDEKVCRYNAHFRTHKSRIEAALSDAFGLDAAAVFNDLTANVTLNPICPR